MARWRFVLRFRWPIFSLWLVVLLPASQLTETA
jgi:uncharacterized membrane protein YdfJ with MMPL/SSD domain